MRDRLEGLFDLHAFPLLGDTGALHIIGHIRAMREDWDADPIMLVHETRHAVRCVAAVLPPGDNGPVQVAQVCGLVDVPVGQFVAALTGTGLWDGELGAEGVRGFLYACIGAGHHPLTLATEIGMDPEDYVELEALLDLEDHWADTVKDRVLAVVKTGANVPKVREMLHCNRRTAWKWWLWARRALREMPN